jgi:hypothetical protein
MKGEGERGRGESVGGADKTDNTDQVDLPPWDDVVPDERAEDGEPGTEYCGSILGLEIIRDERD